jgi:purine-nucleoside/S-methyl-5'-thioadenosine phosphorylase / adenosine deaminase
MKREFKTDYAKARIFFGPSANVCCYEVKEDIIETLKNTGFANKVIIKRQDKFFLDLLLFNKLQLQDLGVNPSLIDVSCSKCTICDYRFNSYRRYGIQAKRQVSFVYLKY